MEINGNYLLALGYPEGKVMGIALDVIQAEYADSNLKTITSLLEQVLQNPSGFLEDKKLSPIAFELLKPAKEAGILALNESPETYKIYGAAGIEEGAIKQMETAMKLPVTVAGALMPDAHQGYGLPIGGVLATKNAVIPYGVGVDIGCRMCMSIYELPAGFIDSRKEDLKEMLNVNTKFGRATLKSRRIIR